MLDALKVFIASILTTIALILNPVPKITQEKNSEVVKIATPASEIATKSASKETNLAIPENSKQKDVIKSTSEQLDVDCLKKIESFKAEVYSLGIPPYQIDAAINLIKSKCNTNQKLNPTEEKINELEQRINQTEYELQQRKDMEKRCGDKGVSPYGNYCN